MPLFLNLELASSAKLCLVSGLPYIVKDYPKIRNLPKIFLSSFENVCPVSYLKDEWLTVFCKCFYSYGVTGKRCLK